jgi:hypothetical protein
VKGGISDGEESSQGLEEEGGEEEVAVHPFDGVIARQ